MGSYWYLPALILLLPALLGSVCCLQNVSGIVGGSVTLTSTLNLPAQSTVTWMFGTDRIAYAALSDPAIYDNSCIGRCTLYGNTTLRLGSLTPADTGEYTLSVYNVLSGTQQTELFHLSVYSAVRSVETVAGTVGKSVYLSVKLDLPAQRQVTWRVNSSTQIVNAYPGGSIIYSDAYRDRCTLYENTTLRLDNLTPADTGNYTLTVTNPTPVVPVTESGSVYLTVYTNVLGVALSSNASSGLILVGKDSVRLSCSALGTNVTFSWHLDGAPLPTNPRYHLMNSNSSLIISPVERTDNGSFTCTASNSVNSETSSALTLSLGRSPDGNVQCNADKLDQTVTLSCSWPGGNPAATVTLIFQNNRYTAQDTVNMDVPVNAISSGAELACLGTQEGHITVSTMILGTPIGATSGSGFPVKEGENVTMSVNLDWSRTVSPRIQILPATFSWFHLNPDPSLLISGGKISVISSGYKSKLVIFSVTASEHGNYKCVAENFLGNSTFVFEISVDTGSSSSSQLSPGAIAGIVIAALFVGALIPLTVIFILRKKNNKNTPTPTNPVYENTGAQAPSHYDRIIPGSKENMAGNNPQESSYQELQFPHRDVYNNFRNSPR